MKHIKTIRLFSLLLVVVMTMSLFPVQAFAATTEIVKTKLSDLDFSNNNVWNTLKSGTKSAFKSNNQWWYKFTKGSYVIKLPLSAFQMTQSNPQLAKANRTLTTACNNIQNKKSVIPYFTNSRRRETTISPAAYSTHIYRMQVEVQGETKDDITLKTSLLDKMTFTFYSQILSQYNGGTGTTYVKPSTAKGYNAALARYVNTDDTPKIGPVFDIAETAIGTKKVSLSKFRMCGIGNASKNAKLIDYLTVCTNLTKLATSLASGNWLSAASSALSLGTISSSKLVPSSISVNTGEWFALSNGSIKTYATRFNLDKNGKCAFTISEKGDFAQYEIRLNTNRDKSTKYQIAFSFK